jgi:hypothetical protein
MLQEKTFEIYPMSTNFGFTLIKLPATKLDPDESYKSISYAAFMEFMKNKKLYSDEEIINMLRNQNV